ncbi:ATP-binding cassette domain-containing protein, partial [uncultured Anaerotruncus sp.]|uniref:ATP-binding cassette domain-containing protein n=1 Tax=uncultured Anaerotruncus sp. TaxID=905011 RepID=UPI00258506E5
MYLLQARDLKKSFGVRTLFSVDKLEVHDGDRIGLVGANGAGKSTLLNILFGGEPADEGTIDRRCPIALVRQSGEAEGEGDGRTLREWAVADGARKSGGGGARAPPAGGL